MDQALTGGARGAQWGALNTLLACPACRSTKLHIGDTAVACSDCDAEYPIDDGIIDFLAGRETAQPAFYDDAAYRKFIDGLGRIHEAHYQPGSIPARLEQALKADLTRLMGGEPAPIVDLGCGAGSGFDQFGGAANIIGVDSEMGLLKKARDRFPQATLIRAALENLPFRTGSLRTVVASAVIEHVFFLERTMENVARCLTRTGHFYVMVPTEGGLAVATARLVTSQRNAALLGLTPAQSRRAQRIDHCNTIFAIENAARKYFITMQTKAWPFRVGGSHLNLVKSFRFRPIDAA